VNFVRKAVRSIGRLAIKVETIAESCISVLVELMENKISYAVQEAIIVVKDIFRRYPGQYEGIIPKLCENMDLLDESEAKAAIIWIIGHYSNHIDNAAELFDDLTYTFIEETTEVCALVITCACLIMFIGSASTTNWKRQTLSAQARLSICQSDCASGTQDGHGGDRQSRSAR
jgi:AP-2 complex subunit beta-1